MRPRRCTAAGALVELRGHGCEVRRVRIREAPRVRWQIAVAARRVLRRAGVVVHEQAVALLKRLAVLGRRLTVGKLAEAISLDYRQHRRAWSTAWMASIT